MVYYLWIYLCSLVSPNPQYEVTSYQLRGLTASGFHTTKINAPFVAVSRDLLKLYPIGSTIQLYDCEFTGLYKVMDTMNKRITNTIDVYSKPIPKGRTACKCFLMDEEKAIVEFKSAD